MQRRSCWPSSCVGLSLFWHMFGETKRTRNPRLSSDQCPFSTLVADLVSGRSDALLTIVVVGACPSQKGADHRPRESNRRMPGPPERQRPAGGWGDLTDRERAVAVLAGHALTNQQIARRLAISPHTVNYHLRQIFRKLAIDSRVRLALLIRELESPDTAPMARPANEPQEQARDCPSPAWTSPSSWPSA